MEDEYVSTRPNGDRDYCGIGNIVIPKDKDPAKYIERCFRVGVVSVVMENGGVVDNVLISKSVFKDIEFPVDYKGLGSQVLWLNKPRLNQPIIIGLFSKNNEFTSVNQDRDSLRKASSNGVFEVIVDRDKGIVIINSSSTVEANSSSTSSVGGDIHIVSINKNKTSKLNVSVSGSVAIQTPEFNIESSRKMLLTLRDPSVDDTITVISYERGVGFNYKDEFGNQGLINKDNIQLKPVGKFNIGDGNEPLVLGTTLKSFMDDFIDEVAKATVTTALGTMPLLNAAQILLFKERTQSLLSKLSNTD